MSFDVTYYSRIYRDFRAIGTKDYPSVLHYYEKHEDGIQQLEFAEYFEMLAAYTYALYNLNEHNKHILMAEVLIGESINNNIKQYKEEDVFYNTLLRKAISYCRLLRFKDAEHILHELIKIQPENVFAQRELNKCLFAQKPKYIKNLRALSVLLFFISAAVIVIELIFIKFLFPNLTHYFEYTRIVLFLTGIVVLVASEFYFKRATKIKSDALIKGALESKR
ncbi:MAG: tetratricopeptide (TPR) repeat protein [Saprospiraceae bacterium]|jgi:tetratricopeptide (TPR) repeat protein